MPTSDNPTPYFLQLNYTLGNEDTSLEWAMAQELKPKRVLAVCGSGGRSLPLLTAQTEKLVLVDLSAAQLFLARARAATYRDLAYDQFLRFWGYAPYAEDDLAAERKRLFDHVRFGDEVRAQLFTAFENRQWAPILYTGSWERTFATLSKLVRLVLGKHVIRLFSHRDGKALESYLRKDFPHWRWWLIIALLGNRQVFNALLYKGHFIKKNVPQSYVSYYREAYERLFAQGPVRQSFFMNLCFFGKIAFIEGNPLEARPEVHAQLKDELKQGGRVEFQQKDVLNAQGGPFDFVSISVVPSYFGGELERDYLQKLKNLLAPKATVVVRYYLRVCEADTKGYLEVTADYQDLVDSERVQMYRVKVYRLA